MRAGESGRLLIHLVNYADQPADSVTIWASGRFSSARLLVPGAAPSEAPFKRSGGRTEVTIQRLCVYGALLLE